MTTHSSDNIRLTDFSHGGGCGCKLSPKELDKVLHSEIELPDFPNLVVGNATRDDAAVYDLGDSTGVISTTDFFTPIVDDPFTFGRIAATNAISDVYAMGGTPLMAVAILGWPIQKLPPELAAKVIDGGRKACLDANIPLAGGHSIDAAEVLFGLAVTGRVPLNRLKRNNQASTGCRLYLTKPLGVGILTNADKKRRSSGRTHSYCQQCNVYTQCSWQQAGNTARSRRNDRRHRLRTARAPDRAV